MNTLNIIPGKRYRNIGHLSIYQVFAVAKDSESPDRENPDRWVVYVTTEPHDLLHQLVLHQLGLLFMWLASRLIRTNVWVRPMPIFEIKFEELDQ